MSTPRDVSGQGVEVQNWAGWPGAAKQHMPTPIPDAFLTSAPQERGDLLEVQPQNEMSVESFVFRHMDGVARHQYFNRARRTRQLCAALRKSNQEQLERKMCPEE